MSYTQNISTELAFRAFNADCEFSSALSELQSNSHGITCVPALLARANKHGFSWILRPSRPPIEQPWEVILRHLLGFPLLVTSQPHRVIDIDEGPESQKQPELNLKEETAKPVARADPEKQITAVQGAAPEGIEPDGPTALLSEQQRLAAIEMVKVLNANARKVFTNHFRSAFKIPGSERSLIPLITELQHLQFIDRFTIESSGGVAE